MTIPTNLTHAEVGAFLAAVAVNMMDYDLAAETVLCWDSYTDPEDAMHKFAERIAEQDVYGDLTLERAEELVQLTLAEAISFNEMDRP